MEKKHLLLIGLIIIYIIIVYLFSLIGDKREIGKRRLFWISLFLTPVLGFAFFISSHHKKLVLYREKRYKCEECGYVFSEDRECCPICEKEGKNNPLKEVEMFMT